MPHNTDVTEDECRRLEETKGLRKNSGDPNSPSEEIVVEDATLDDDCCSKICNET